MAQPLPLPVRVLVKGASTVGWSSSTHGPRSEFTFPRAIEANLFAAGRPADVRAITVSSERTVTTLRRWESELVGFSPDVLVLVYGHYESIHLFLPRWLERHANSLAERPRKWEQLYRRIVLRRVWMFLARLQSRIDTRIDPTIRRDRPRNVAADLEKLIGYAQRLNNPLIYVFELLPPAKRYQSWFPGMTKRIEAMNRAIADLVERLDRPDVRYFRVSELVGRVANGDIDTATPDGFHYSAEMHHAIGEQLAREIGEWADTQDHLQLPAAGAARRRAARHANGIDSR